MVQVSEDTLIKIGETHAAATHTKDAVDRIEKQLAVHDKRIGVVESFKARVYGIAAVATLALTVGAPIVLKLLHVAG